MDNNIMENVIDFFVRNYNGKSAAGRKEVTLRCPICGDSSKDIKDRHLYIGLNKNNLICYSCFLCNSSGLVNYDFIKKLDQNNVNYSEQTDVVNKITNYNRAIMNLPQNRILRDNQSKFIRVPKMYVRDSEESYKKIKKFNSRLGTNLSIEDICRLKIIPNIKDFLEVNNIREYTRDENSMNILDTFFLGFLSSDNSHINLRRMIDKGKLPPYIDRRYIQYNIFNKLEDTSRYYFIPSVIDTLNPEPIKICISEGPFDILSIYLNIEKRIDQRIYCCISGKSYLGIIQDILEQYGLINIEIHLYIDNDILDYTIRSIANSIKVFNIPLYIHRNTFNGEKDFGVDSDHIIDTYERLL